MTESESILLNAISSVSKMVGGVQIKFYTNRYLSIFKNQGMIDSDFCRLVKSCPEGYRRCTECDRHSQNRSKVMRTAFVYNCHMGLTEMIHPVFSDGAFVGSFFWGQFHREHDDIAEIFRDNEKRLKSWRIPLEEAHAKFDSLPVFSDERINDVRALLDLFAIYSVKSELITLERDPYLEVIEQYIEEHLTDNITLEHLAEHLHLSPAYISSLFSKRKNVPLFRYIQARRVDRACYLLRSTKEPVKNVCAQSGFADQNYFARVFKELTGTTALDYRRHYSVYDSKEFFLRI